MKPKTREIIEKYLKEMAEVAASNIEHRWKVKGDIIVKLAPKNDKEIEVVVLGS